MNKLVLGLTTAKIWVETPEFGVLDPEVLRALDLFTTKLEEAPAVGSVVGLLVMKADFGFMVILGLLALAGSIVNNGIVMIDKIEENRRDGQTPYDAVINSAVSRFRPILLSVSTTMLGFSPLIINHDPLFYGMACVMFFGLGIGSLFTLNYVPALYSIFFRVKVPGR